MPILYFTIGHTAAGQGGYFDIPSGFSQTVGNQTVWITSIAIAFSIAFFNFSGLAVTKSVSATARSLIDTCRTVGIWAVSLFLGWEQLAFLQIVGFTLLVYGTLCFNDVIALPSFLGFRGGKSDDDCSALPASAPAAASPQRYGSTTASDNGRPAAFPRAASDDAQVVVIRHDAANNERTPLVAGSLRE